MDTQKTAATAVADEPLPPEIQLTQMFAGFFVSQAIYVAAKLGIADLLKEKPQQIARLAAETGTHERSLHRVLRTLASVGLFRETDPKTFALTPTAEPLRSDAPESIRDMIIFMGEEWHWRVYGNMLYSVRTGKPAWGYVHGAEVFDYFQQNPEHGEIFNRAMTGFSHAAVRPVVEAYDFSGINKLCDIAGGHGLLLAGILKANPEVRGILFDLPHVLEGSRALLEQEGVAQRVELVRGDFFAAIPEGADAYMMKHIIHDWDDERAIRILRNIHRAMPASGRLLIVETVIPTDNEPHPGKIADMEMLVSPGGIERTEQEFRELLGEAGFRLQRVVPTSSHLSVVEATRERR